MKTTPPSRLAAALIPTCHWLAALALLLTALPAARAGLTFELLLIREQQGTSYYFYTELTTNSTLPAAALGNYLIASPQQPANGSWRQYDLTTNGLNFTGGGNNSFGDFDSVMPQITNGNWTILFTNATTTNLYQFTVSAPTLTSNMLPALIATLPTENEILATNQPTLTWQWPASWGVNSDAFVFNDGFSFFQYDSLPEAQTSWFMATPLPSAENLHFQLRYTTNYSTPLFVATTPLDTNSAQPIAGWISTSTLQAIENVNFSVSNAVADVFGDALDTTNLTWTTGGDLPWFVETTNTHDSVDAAQSGVIDDGGVSWIETTVTGPGTLSFWWNVSCEENADYLEFYIDGNLENNITGESGWGQQTYPISSGLYTVRWQYAKDGSVAEGQDAGFLDEVSFVATPPPDTNTLPVITLNPFSQTNRPGYQVALLAAATSPTNTPTWQWYKVGPGPISGATNTLHIPADSGTAGVAGDYFAVASNPNGSVTSLTATVTFQSAALPPDWTRAFTSAFTNNPAHTTADINLASLFDSAGNIYTVGSVTGTNVFGSNVLISVNGQESSSFLKQTATGTPIWGRSMTNNGNGSSFPRGLAAAPGDGFYVVGVSFGTNWLGTNQLVNTGGATYLARFDANGSNLWLRTVVGTNANFPTHHTLVSDPAGNVTLSVLISGDTSFGTTNLFAEGQRGVLAQYDPNGNVRWVEFPSAWPDYLTYSAGRIYGSMDGNLTNYIGGVTNLSDRRRALFSINATNGQGLWVQGYAAHKDQVSPGGYGDNNATVAVSGTNVFVVGSAYGTNVTFGPFTLDYPETTGQYFARYDTNGNAQLATACGSQFTWPWAALADTTGNVYVGCDFDTYAIFGSNLIAAPFYETVQSIGTNTDLRIPGQACVAKFDRNGNALWARPAQSQSSYLNLRDITLASDGVWACGFFKPIADFGTNTIYGGLPPYHLSGYLAKITDGAATPNAVTLLSPSNNGSQFQFSFTSQSGFTHSVLYRTNLAVGTWQTWSNVTGDGSLKTLAMPASVFGGSKNGFVRVSTQ